MLLRTIFFIYVGFIYSLPANMIEHEGHIIESNTLIIKFTNKTISRTSTELSLFKSAIRLYSKFSNIKILGIPTFEIEFESTCCCKF